jgi:hypothetical protein
VIVANYDNFIFDSRIAITMADAMFMYGVTTGIFAFLVAVTFGARGARKRRGPGEQTGESHSTGSSGGEKRRIKRFKSDGTPVYE